MPPSARGLQDLFMERRQCSLKVVQICCGMTVIAIRSA